MMWLASTVPPSWIFLEGGDVDDAMDVAKQGFSRLQKIK